MTHLVAPEVLVASLQPETLACVACHRSERLADVEWSEIEGDLASGGSLIMVGAEHLQRLRHLWVASQPCSEVGHRDAAVGELPREAVAWQTASCSSLCFRPDKVHVYFGVDEMPRAEVIPLVEAVGKDGAACAWPGVWIKHTASSLVSGRFDGANLFLFAFENPLEAASVDDWARLITDLARRAAATIAIAGIRTLYALYHAGERVRAEVAVANRSPHIASFRLCMEAIGPDGAVAHRRVIRRHANPAERLAVPWDFKCSGPAGLWRVRARLYAEDRFSYGDERDASGALIEGAECGFVMATEDASSFVASRIDGAGFSIQGRDGFLAGTHYYPSSSWWDWAWRDFRPERSARDLDEMARCGYTFARVWIDPELDEDALRGFEAWLHLSGSRGIVSIVCVFTQWARHLAYPDGDGMVSFDFAPTTDYNVYSVQLKNIDHQKRYLGVLARRWARLPNVIWNLSNEAFIVDPDPDQVDPAHFGDVEPKNGPLAGAAYFNRWADIMTATLREEGAQQPVLRGYGFVNGGDCYLQNRDGAMLLWHHYVDAETAGPALAFASPGTIDKPLLLEEFGIPTLDEAERLERYEGIACWAAAMGAAGACAYEWGVSWPARELPFTAAPLRSSSLSPDPDPRWMEGQIVYSASWPIGSMGLCPWAASFAYGSNLPCTPFASTSAHALGEVARFCSDIGPPYAHEPVLVVVPMEWQPFAPLQGYMRVLDPTIAAIQSLATEHVPFSVIHEDQLPAYRGAAESILFPASQAARPEASEFLERCASRGVTVHLGRIDPTAPDLAAHALPIESERPVWCIRRATRHGRLYMLYAPEGPTSVRLSDGAQSLEVNVARYALAEALDHGSWRTWIGRSGSPRT